MAGKNLRYGVLLLALLCMAYRTNAAVTNTTCTDDTACMAVDPNAVCDTAVDPKICKCMDIYRVNPDDDTKCVLVIGSNCSSPADCNALSNTACTADKCACAKNYVVDSGMCKIVIGMACTAENAATKCTVDNSECVELKCACKTGYKKTDAGACEMILGMNCTQVTDCNMVNSVCGTDKKCGCATNYEAKDGACLKMVGQTCTSDTECATNKCEGDEGKKKCVAENNAQTVVVSAGTITLSLLLLAFQRIF